MSNPRVTVVIPNHNYGRWIQGAILSAVKQDYENKEIVVYCDGCTDDSWEKIAEICDKNTYISIGSRIDGTCNGIRLIVIGAENANGPSFARNQIIILTQEHSDLFAMLDADDEFQPGKLTKSVEKFDNFQFVGGVYTDYDTVSIDTGLRLREFKEPFSRERLLQDCIVHSGAMVSKLALSKVGLYDEEMRTCEDYDLWIRIAEHFVFIHIPESLVLVRVGSHNSTATVDKSIWNKNWQRIKDKMIQRTRNV